MATLTVQKPGLTGAVVTLAAAAAGGDTFANDGQTMMKVTNGGVGSINVTVNSQRTCDQGSDHDIVVAVGAGVTKDIGPFDPYRFGGMLLVTYSGVTSVSVGAYSTAAA